MHAGGHFFAYDAVRTLPELAAIAQPVEQLICNETVQGSIPCGGTKHHYDTTMLG